MKYLINFNLFFATLVAVSVQTTPVRAAESSCIKTQILRGDSCNNLQVNFDFSSCDTQPLAKQTARSSCVNQKAVAFVKTPKSLYIATYAAPVNPGESWRFLTLRQESRTPGSMVVELKKKDTDKTGIEKEDIPGDEVVKPTPALVVIPSNPPVADAPKVAPVEEAPSPETSKQTMKEVAASFKEATVTPLEVMNSQPKEIDFPPHVKVAKAEKPTEEAAVVAPAKDKEIEHAATEEQKLQISGFVDFYYLLDSNNPPAVTSTGTATPPAGNVKYRAFDIYNDSFNLSLAELTLKKDIGNVGGQVDLGFGNTAQVISPQDAATQNILQAFVYMNLDDHWKVTAGKKATHMSFEGDYATENFNYSHSLLYTFAIPTWQTGVSLDYTSTPKNWNAGIFAYNGWTGPYQMNQKTAGARFSYRPNSAWSFNYTGITGTQPTNSQGSVRQAHEANLLWKVKKEAAIALDYVWGYQTTAFAGQDVNWSSFVVSGKYTWGRYTLAPRVEFYADPQGYSISGGLGSVATLPYATQNIISGTLTNWWEIKEGARAILELRDDSSDQNVFTDTNGKPIGTQFTGTLAFLYEF
jgi:hypothetical protein